MHDGRQPARPVLHVRDMQSDLRAANDGGDALRSSGLPDGSTGIHEPVRLDDAERPASLPKPLEVIDTPKKRRKKGASPSARTLAECRKRGWIAQVVERFNSYTNRLVDLFGVIDVVVITPTGILGIQATSGDNHASRRVKIFDEPRAKAWLQAGAALQVWSWSKRGSSGKRKLWTLRVEDIRVEDFAADVARETEVTQP